MKRGGKSVLTFFLYAGETEWIPLNDMMNFVYRHMYIYTQVVKQSLFSYQTRRKKSPKGELSRAPMCHDRCKQATQALREGCPLVLWVGYLAKVFLLMTYGLPVTSVKEPPGLYVHQTFRLFYFTMSSIFLSPLPNI